MKWILGIKGIGNRAQDHLKHNFGLVMNTSNELPFNYRLNDTTITVTGYMSSMDWLLKKYHLDFE
jgi:hypothetical protein